MKEIWTCFYCGKRKKINLNKKTDWIEEECWTGHRYHVCPECRSIHALRSGNDCPVCLYGAELLPIYYK